jgi:hypothetical protein
MVKRATHASGEYALSRAVDARSGARGWTVAMRRHHVSYRRFFSDARWGGKAEARAAALAYRAELEQRVPRPSRARIADKLRRNNTSGIPGVSRSVRRDRSGRERVRWAASWTPEPGGRPKSRLFDVSRYGEPRAKALAVEVRRLAMRKLEQELHVPARGPRRPGPARPPSVPKARMVLRVTIEKEVREWIDEASRDRGVRMSEIVSEIVSEAYERRITRR